MNALASQRLRQMASDKTTGSGHKGWRKKLHEMRTFTVGQMRLNNIGSVSYNAPAFLGKEYKLLPTERRIMTDLFDKANNWTAADDVRKTGLYPYFRPNTSSMGTEVTIGGKKMIMVGSNNYLGLVTHPEVLEAMVQAIRKYGSACTGSPFLNGTLDIRVELEQKLAEYVHMESALVYSTGFQANLGALSTIATRGDYIISDRENHASIVDGCKLSFAKTVKYGHSDMEDLERVLSNHAENPKLIVTDAVFSMGGDICD